MTQSDLENFESRGIFRVVIENYKDVSTMFILKRGLIADWAIYYHPVDYIVKSWDSELETMIECVKRTGNKLQDEDLIRSLSNCDEEMFSHYRF